ncbi:hypothetical protein HpRN169_04390 [Helicobacter pylori]
MANESIEGKAYQLEDILATELSAYYNPYLPTPLPMDRRKLRKAFRRFVF